MRRKITKTLGEAAEAVTEELSELTPKQMKFVEGILSGKSSTDAYRAAYDCSRSAASTVWPNACRLRSDSKVSAMLVAARKAGLGNAKLTLERHISELERLREIALESGNVGAAVQAEQLRGKASGHYIERYSDVTESDPMNVLHELHKTSPTLAAQLAKENGIPWPAADSVTAH